MKVYPIAIDARMMRRTGIGRYITNLLTWFGQNPDCGLLKIFALVDKITDMNGLHQRLVHAPVFSLKEQIELPIVVWSEQVALFHSPQFNIPMLAGIPLVVTIHDCAFSRIPEEVPSLKARVYYQLMMSQALKRSEKIIAVSQSTKEDIIHFYGIPSEKIQVIYNGIDLSFFHKEPNEVSRDYLRKRYGIDRPYGLYVGMQRPRKNLRTLLLAIKRSIEDLGPHFKFVFVGPIDTRFIDLRREAFNLGIDDLIVQTGPVMDEELLILYKGATFFAFPSIYEGFGLPVLEAMAAGVPVLASNASSIPEIAGDAAILVDPLDIEAMSESIVRLLTDEELRLILREKGYKQVTLFSWESCASRTLETYRSILNV